MVGTADLNSRTQVFVPRNAPDFPAIMGKSSPLMPFDFSLALKSSYFHVRGVFRGWMGFRKPAGVSRS